MTDEQRWLQERHDFLVAANTKAAQSLQEKGLSPQGDTVIAKRLEMLIEHLLGTEDSVERLHFEIEWQEYMATVYERGHNAVKEMERQQRLARLSGRPAPRTIPASTENGDGPEGLVTP